MDGSLKSSEGKKNGGRSYDEGDAVTNLQWI